MPELSHVGFQACVRSRLVLQLHFSADPSSVMALARDGLVGPTPRRPCENEGAWNDIGQQQAYDQGADLRDGERDERATVCVGLLLFRLPRACEAASARIAVRKARASMASVTWRSQPCQLSA